MRMIGQCIACALLSLNLQTQGDDRVSFKDPLFLRLDVKSLQCVCLRSLSLKITAKPSLSAQMSESLLL